MTDYLGDFCPDFSVPINNTHRNFINVFWVKKGACYTQLNTVCMLVSGVGRFFNCCSVINSLTNLTNHRRCLNVL